MVPKSGSDSNVLIGCDGRIFLEENLIQTLRTKGLCTLNQLANWEATTIWNQAWHSSTDLELDVQWEQDWQNYISSLHQAHIHLIENLDELAWAYPHSGGSYLAKLGYCSLRNCEEENTIWWHKLIWKIKGPPKTTLFFWLVLKGRVLTWDRLQRIGHHGPVFFLFVFRGRIDLTSIPSLCLCQTGLV
jgi:hypothetical protein